MPMLNVKWITKLRNDHSNHGNVRCIFIGRWHIYKRLNWYFFFSVIAFGNAKGDMTYLIYNFFTRQRKHYPFEFTSRHPLGRMFYFYCSGVRSRAFDIFSPIKTSRARIICRSRTYIYIKLYNVYLLRSDGNNRAAFAIVWPLRVQTFYRDVRINYFCPSFFFFFFYKEHYSRIV